MLNRAKKAFTLLELIVVLLVLGVLAAIAVPTYTTVKTNSVKRSINSSLGSIDRAGEAAYASDTNMTDEMTAFASIDGIGWGSDDDPGTPGIQAGDRTITVTSDGAGTGDNLVTVTLVSGTIECSGTVSFVGGEGTVTAASC